VHASLWKFAGDPDELLARYDAMISEIGASGMRLHVCLRAADGILMLDTCPDRETFEAFAAGAGFRELRERHGLPEPERVDDYPVHLAYAGGQAIHGQSTPPLRSS
jgi:hypothetical protein